MDTDCYSKRTDYLRQILEEDTRLDDGVETDTVTVLKGTPDERLYSPSGVLVYVHWDSSPTIAMQKWAGGRRQDHIATYKIWWVVTTYSSKDAAAETKFEHVAANILAIIADHCQKCNHWQSLEIVSGGSALLEPAKDQYWRVGGFTVRMVFREAV